MRGWERLRLVLSLSTAISPFGYRSSTKVYRRKSCFLIEGLCIND